MGEILTYSESREHPWMKRNLSGPEMHCFTLDSKPGWEFWESWGRMDVICMWKECKWLLPEKRIWATAKTMALLLFYQGVVSLSPCLASAAAMLQTLANGKLGNW